MYPYRAPLREMRFVLHEVLHVGHHYAELGRTDVTADLIDSILEEAGKFAENVVSPTLEPGDQVGVRLENGQVITPPGFREAYQAYVDAGWKGLCGPEEYGGQGLPEGFAWAIDEMYVGASMAWKMYSGLTDSAILTLERHAPKELRDLIQPKLVAGEWTGTMCLTEAQAGSDLGVLRTRAEPVGDGTYRITGSKIFITSGDHDLTPNIVHLVLARLPDAPPGTKGISLFLVPKIWIGADASLKGPNGVTCGRVEHKMGLKGSSTCVIDFNESRGWLVGAPNAGLKCMFTMMNHARLGVGIQGICQGERALQASIAYALDRRQGRALRGPASPDKPADLIIEHADVRRMLLTQKALVEGGRVLSYFAGLQMDKAAYHPDEAERKRAEEVLSILTPIVKAFLTDAGVECTSLGVQVHGGHGYVSDTGVEQFYRDARIAPIYEGTNGIQAMDLLGRKVLGSGGQLARLLGGMIGGFCQSHSGYDELADFVPRLAGMLKEWSEATQKVAARAMRDPDEVGAAAYDYMQLTGYLCLAWCWAKMAAVAVAALKQKPADPGFYEAKLATARFYYKRILPRAEGHLDALEDGAQSVMSLTADKFAV